MPINNWMGMLLGSLKPDQILAKSFVYSMMANE
jgi:hypothetical protein